MEPSMIELHFTVPHRKGFIELCHISVPFSFLKNMREREMRLTCTGYACQQSKMSPMM